MQTALMIGLCSLLLLSCTTMADARIEQARYESNTKIAQAEEATKQAALWSATLPILAIIVAGAGAAYLILYYRGKAHIIQVQAQVSTMLPPPPSRPALPEPVRRAQASTMLPPPPSRPALPEPVRRACLEYDATATPDPSHPGAWIVVAANGYKVRMLPPPR